MITVERVLTDHGSWLSADPVTGQLCHLDDVSAELANTVRAYTPSTDADWSLLTARRPIVAHGEPLASDVLSYHRVPVDGGIALVLPSTGKMLSALPGGEVSASRDAPGGWETFVLVPAQPDPEIDPRFADLAGLGKVGSDTIEHYAAKTAAEPAILSALFRLLDPAEARRAATAINRLPIYERVFPALRMHLSAHQGRFEWITSDRLRHGIDHHGWRIGEHTYGAPEVIDGQYGALSIGRYCSIAGNVQIVVGNHEVNTATTYPFAALHQFWPSADPAIPDHTSKGVVIGHNVWLGVGVCILPGARIGDGAVIGARAVVSGTIPPFTIAVGSPARPVRARFDERTIERLLKLQWWNWPDHVVDRFLPLMLSHDMEAFLSAAEAESTTIRYV